MRAETHGCYPREAGGRRHRQRSIDRRAVTQFTIPVVAEESRSAIRPSHRARSPACEQRCNTRQRRNGYRSWNHNRCTDSQLALTVPAPTLNGAVREPCAARFRTEGQVRNALEPHDALRGPSVDLRSITDLAFMVESPTFHRPID